MGLLHLEALFNKDLIMSQPFSFQFPDEVSSLVLQQPKFIKASDGLELAYYDFVPENPAKILVFYHGGGVWSNQLYQYMAQELKNNHNIGTYLFDIRGHGNSQGPRGDAPSTDQVWQDVSSAIDFVHALHPNKTIILGGHSSGAGLILNYCCWKEHPAIAEYLFLAPFLGVRSGTAYEHIEVEKRFVKSVRIVPLIMSILSRGYLFAHTPVIFLNYPESERQKDSHLLEYYTSAMALATTPNDAQQLLAKLNKPVSVLIGECDEQFDPNKVIKLIKQAVLDQNQSVLKIIPQATHLSIVTEIKSIADCLQK